MICKLLKPILFSVMMPYLKWLSAKYHSLRGFRQNCQANNTPFLPTLIRSYWYKFQGVNLLAPPEARIKGLQNIYTPNGVFSLILSCGAIDGIEPTTLDVQGKCFIHGSVALGRGCRIDIGAQAAVDIGDQTYINPRTQLVIKHGLHIGAHCAISWECQILDEDFHVLSYEGQRPVEHPAIRIGDRVWIGSRVSIYKGTVIPNGCVVASNSVVKGVFTEENALLAGSPARVVRRNVQW